MMTGSSSNWGRTVLQGLFGAGARVTVLTWLCQHPEEPIHTRELARRCNLSPNQTWHARRLILQMAEVAVTRDLFAQILSRVRRLAPLPT